MTPSAARGLIEAVLWKPAIKWKIEKIRVLSEVRFTSFRRNEVNTRAATPSISLVTGGGVAPIYYADEDRAQRNTVALRDVDYVIQARFQLSNPADRTETVAKFVEMFERRVRKGQHYHQPYFGCREFVAYVQPAEGAPEPVSDTRELGPMLWDIDFGAKDNTPMFFEARLVQGVLDVPSVPTYGGPR
jgi:CRISPR-associated protein Cas5d